METQELENVDTQELANELFSRDDWQEAHFPEGTKVQRGKFMTMNTAEEVDQDAVEVKAWPIIRLDKMSMDDALEYCAEGVWRKHVNAFRQEENVELAEKHREEHTIGRRKYETTSGDVKDAREVEIHAPDAGEIDSQEQKKMEAKQIIANLKQQGFSDEEINAMVEDA